LGIPPPDFGKNWGAKKYKKIIKIVVKIQIKLKKKEKKLMKKEPQPFGNTTPRFWQKFGKGWR